MEVKVEFSELEREAKAAGLAGRLLLRNARRKVREVSLAVNRRVKVEMPVDTGRARAGWGWGGGGVQGPQEGIWSEAGDGLTITQGTNVEYVAYLERGHSRQAPAGFIARAAEAGAQELVADLGSLDPLAPEGE